MTTIQLHVRSPRAITATNDSGQISLSIDTGAGPVGIEVPTGATVRVNITDDAGSGADTAGDDDGDGDSQTETDRKQTHNRADRIPAQAEAREPPKWHEATSRGFKEFMDKNLIYDGSQGITNEDIWERWAQVCGQSPTKNQIERVGKAGVGMRVGKYLNIGGSTSIRRDGKNVRVWKGFALAPLEEPESVSG